ncbi:hypothetical protein GCM10023149_08660 [Mucilaginibacter gynuensis]|uniref:TraB family protein n=1 Tax=Mucilaginibacter gynuensis TaxID=1302236 RepID=A0ABP8FXH4_9SPHI
MAKVGLIALACLLFAGCVGSQSRSTTADTTHVYPTVSYLKIKLDAAGHLPTNPYIRVYKNGPREIVFCGTNHLDHSDTENPMYTTIENKFFEIKPDICVNEGGDVSKRVYKDRHEAISKNGEIGLIKILADSLKIQCINGDMTDSLEFKGLLKHYTKGEMLAYIATERCMWSVSPEKFNDTAFISKKYKNFIEGYIIKTGNVNLTSEEQTLAFYKANYQKLLNRPFSFEELEPTNPFSPKGKFQEIGRRSKEIRDQSLLKTIDTLLNKHDKVFIVFGGWHLLTSEPGLQQIINKKR